MFYKREFFFVGGVVRRGNASGAGVLNLGLTYDLTKLKRLLLAKENSYIEKGFSECRLR